MLYFIFLTRKCNLKCIYCGEAANPTTSISSKVNYSFIELKEFLHKDPNPIIVFYGGEPLLNIPMLQEIIDQIPKATYLLQTNGYYLNQLPLQYLDQINTILISIDGSEDTTDHYRGKGAYKQIINNLRSICLKGYEGDIIARMTISTHSDIYEDVTSLLFLENPIFKYVHWQLNVIWSDRLQWNDFNHWVNQFYNPGVSKLIDKWISHMKLENEVLGIIPFIGVIRTLLLNEKATLRCGAGIDAFAIQTNGEIYACPICPEFEDFKVGHITTTNPIDLQGSLPIKFPCLNCEVYSICGGRCLFTNHHNFWGKDFFLVCETVKHLINKLKIAKPFVEKMIEQNNLTLESFNLPNYNSCEIIP